MGDLLAVALGGALGAVFRYGAVTVSALLLGRQFPWGTLLVNVLGSLLMGMLFVLIAERFPLAVVWRNFVLVGVLGGFTTFSAFSMETLLLLQQDRLSQALLNLSLSVSLCLLAAWWGMLLGQRIN